MDLSSTLIGEWGDMFNKTEDENRWRKQPCFTLLLHFNPNTGITYTLQGQTEQKLNHLKIKKLICFNVECLQWKSWICISVNPIDWAHLAQFPINLFSALLLNKLREISMIKNPNTKDEKVTQNMKTAGK